MENEFNVRGNQLECYFCGDGEIKKSKTTYALCRMDYPQPVFKDGEYNSNRYDFLKNFLKQLIRN